MATGNNFGASFAIDVTDLKTGLAKANRLIREAETQFQQAAASVDDWTQSEELLIKKQQTLNKQIELQESKVNALVKEKENLIKKLKQEGKSDEEISKATDTLNKQIITQSKQLQKMQGDLTKTNKLLDQWEDNAESLTKTQKSLTEQIDVQTKKIEDLSKKKKQLIDKLKEEQGVQEKIKSSISGVSAEITEQTTKLSSLQKQKQDLIGKLQEEGKNHDEVKAALSEVSAKIDDQTTKITSLQQKKQQLSDELDQEVKKYGNVEAAIRDVNDQMSAEEKKLSDLQTTLNQTNKKLQDFQEEQTDSRTALQKLNDEINDQEAELRDLQTRYQNVVLEQGDSSDAAQELAGRIGTLNTALGLNKSRLKDAQTAMNHMMDDTSDNVIQVVRLKDKINSQRQELERLKVAYQESVEQTGKNSKSSRALKKEIDSLTASLGKNEEAYAKMSRVMELSEELAKQKKAITDLRNENLKWRDALDGLHNAYWETEDDLKELNEAMTHAQNEYDRTAKELKKAEKAYSDLSDEQKENIKVAQNLVKEADDAAKSQKNLGEAAKESAEGFTIAKGAISTFIGNGLTKLVDIGKNAVSTLWNLGESTKEYRTELGKVENMASGVGASTEYIGEKWRDMSSVLGDENAVGEGLNNLLIAGFTAEEQMDQVTNYLEGAALKWKDTLKFEGLADGLQETLATGAATGPFAELLERSGVVLDNFNAGLEQCTTDAEKQNYVLQELSKLGLAEFSDAYREQNKNLIASNKSQKEYENTLAKFGEIIEPITTKVRDGFTQILEKLLELISNGDIEGFAQKIDEGFGNFVDNTLPAIINALTWIKDNKDLIAGIAITIGTVSAAIGILNGVLAVQSAIMAANPTTWIIMGIIAAIGLLVAAIVGIVKNWDEIKEAGSKAWESIKNAWAKAGEWFKTNVSDPIANWFSETWAKLKKGASDAWNGIKEIFGKVGSFFKDTFESAWTKVKNVFSTGGKIFDGIKEGIASAFTTIVNKIIGGINKVVALPFKGINAALDKIRNIEILGISPFKGKIGQISVPQIPLLAKGGIVRGATQAIIGERGPEGVFPLTGPQADAWMDKLASKLATKKGNGVVVNQTNNYSQAHSRYELYKTKQDTAAAVRLAMITT